jgi:hypothetical protein
MSEWISCDDRLPEEEGIYRLKKEPFAGTKDHCFGEIDGQAGFYNYSGFIQPTHWQPISPPVK